MKIAKSYSFEIPRGNGKIPFKFMVHEHEDGTVDVSSIHPYDETEYHWARKSAGKNFWRIIREGRHVSTISAFVGDRPDEAAEPLSPQQIAYFLIKADEDAHLEPRRAIW